ncbi:hypothetical protein DWQ65_03615 [Treponema phagedenis]|nr:hypothetical protein C5O78_01075 [Treponema phagedenis]QSH99173.1 hypothetical protein DWQ65_03615 [Treponema phagedenis]
MFLYKIGAFKLAATVIRGIKNCGRKTVVTFSNEFQKFFLIKGIKKADDGSTACLNFSFTFS